MNVVLIDLFYANEEWAKLRRPGAVEFVQRRLSALSKSLSDKPYLDRDLAYKQDILADIPENVLLHPALRPSDLRR